MLLAGENRCHQSPTHIFISCFALFNAVAAAYQVVNTPRKIFLDLQGVAMSNGGASGHTASERGVPHRDGARFWQSEKG
jgi:hypothetical protein